jgi:hypothetical protein
MNNDSKPTRKMVRFCEFVATQTRQPLPSGYQHSFRIARQYLDKYSSWVIGYDQHSKAKMSDNSPAEAAWSSSAVDVDTAVTEKERGTQKTLGGVKSSVTMLIAGCILFGMSLGLSAFDNYALSVIAGLFFLFATLMIFASIASLLWIIPPLAVVLTLFVALRIRVALCISILVVCLWRPWIPRAYPTTNPV